MSGARVVVPFPFVPENPYQRLLYRHLRFYGYEASETRLLRLGWILKERGVTHVLHIHWPKPYYESPVGTGAIWSVLSWGRLILLALRLGVARIGGFVIVWTVHEVYPHEQGSLLLDRAAMRFLARIAHVRIVHDRATARRAADELGVAPACLSVVRHGSFVGVYTESWGRDRTRAELGVRPGGTAFLAFGHVRAYKDLDILVEAFRRLPSTSASLVVAGLVMNEAVAARLEQAASTDPRIRLRLGFVPDDRVADLYAAADVAVVSRGDGGTSGALILALSLGVPVVVSSAEAYVELTHGERAAWLFEPGDADSLAAALARADGARDRGEKARAARSIAADLDWDSVAAQTARLFDGAAPARVRRRSRVRA